MPVASLCYYSVSYTALMVECKFKVDDVVYSSCSSFPFALIEAFHGLRGFMAGVC